MRIRIHRPLAIHEVGARANNEDAIFPPAGNSLSDDRLFLVCDGVGGANKGEIASQLACAGFTSYFRNYVEGVSDQFTLEAALGHVEASFDRYILEHSETRGMGTTMTLLHLHAEGATLAHIGDSRIYHLRDGQILWHTEDHSLVNQLLKQGIISPQEAIDHPRSNVITRAIQGASVRPTSIDVHQINDIQAGDYFFLCSDGILDNFSDEALAYFLTSTRTDAEKMEGIRQRCIGNPNDNFSAYMIHIAEVEVNETSSENPMYAIPVGKGTMEGQWEIAEIVEAVVEEDTHTPER